MEAGRVRDPRVAAQARAAASDRRRRCRRARARSAPRGSRPDRSTGRAARTAPRRRGSPASRDRIAMCSSERRGEPDDQPGGLLAPRHAGRELDHGEAGPEDGVLGLVRAMRQGDPVAEVGRDDRLAGVHRRRRRPAVTRPCGDEDARRPGRSPRAGGRRGADLDGRAREDLGGHVRAGLVRRSARPACEAADEQVAGGVVEEVPEGQDDGLRGGRPGARREALVGDDDVGVRAGSG